MFKNILLIVATTIVVANSGCSTTHPVTAESNILHPEQAGDQMVSDWKEKKTLMEKEGPEIKTRLVRLPGFGLVNIPESWADPLPTSTGWYSCGSESEGSLFWSTGPFVETMAVDKGRGRFDWETSTAIYAVQMHGEKWVQLKLPKIYYSKSWKRAWKEELSKFQD